jgi:predicted metalloprotease
MKWRVGRQSTNVEDRRGSGMGAMGVGGMGIGGLVLVVVVSLLFGKNPLELLGAVQQPTATTQTGEPPPPTEETQLVGAVLGSTEDVWGQVFAQSGSQYPAPTLVLFSNMVASACGTASAAVGPFYCPNDRQVYIDTAFFKEMEAMGGGGDFAQAYVVAHEVGHHIQTITGTAEKVDDLRRRGVPMEGNNGLSVRQELQADCYAGVWGNLAQQQYHWLESGDIEEALGTAAAIGDDRLQKRQTGTVMPDSFTHGTSAQRVRWFKAGFESGDVDRCDTFSARDV